MDYWSNILKYIKIAVFSFMVLAPFTVNAAYASTPSKIGIFNYAVAVSSSNMMKQYEERMTKEYGPKLKELDALRNSINSLQQKINRDGATMSKSQQENTQLEMKRKFEDLQLQERQLQSEKVQSDQAEYKKLAPKLDKAVGEVSNEMKYDMIIDSRMVVHMNSAKNDITREVIEKINKMK